MLEFSQFDSAKDHGFSYTLALVFFIAIFSYVLIPIHYFKYRHEGAIETNYLTEIYDGFKDNTASKLFVFIFIVKRFLMASVIVFMRNANSLVRVILFTLIQIFVLIYTIIVRPYDKVKDNLIEIINDATITILCLTIVICNDESKWFNNLDSILIFFLMSVGVVIGIIVAVDIILSLIQYYRETKSGGRAEEYLENDNQ